MGVYTKFKSFIPETYEIGLIESILFRRFNLCFDLFKFHHEIDKLISVLYKTATRKIWLTNTLKNL